MERTGGCARGVLPCHMPHAREGGVSTGCYILTFSLRMPFFRNYVWVDLGERQQITNAVNARTTFFGVVT